MKRMVNALRKLTCGNTAYAAALLWAAASALPAQTFTTLFSFNGTYGEPQGPGGALVQATDGNFYGTAEAGGNNADCSSGGCGAIFKITPSGALTTLYIFCAQSGCTDGYNPVGLVQGPSGDFYGTTTFGGAHRWGTVFRLAPSGALTTLYSFCAQSATVHESIVLAPGNNGRELTHDELDQWVASFPIEEQEDGIHPVPLPPPSISVETL